MAKTPLLVTGIQGLVGSKFEEMFQDSYLFESLDIHHPTQPVDITKAEQVREMFAQSEADFVVHFAAFTDVTAAAAQAGDTSGVAYQVNVVGTENIVRAAEQSHKHVIHISTAYVFDGDKAEPYLESDTPRSIEWYGETKLQAEQVVQAGNTPWTILRIDQPFRSDPFPKADIIRKMIERMQQPNPAKFFEDHFFGPTFIDDFAKVIDWVIRTQTSGIFHATSGEKWSDFELAKSVCSALGITPHFEASSLSEYLKSAPRPYQRNTALNCDKLKAALDFELTPIPEALKRVQLTN